MKDIKEQIEDIRYLLDDWFLKNNQVQFPEYYLEYSTAGYYESVRLIITGSDIELKINIWDSENYQLEFNDETNEYEPFKDLVIRKVKIAINKLNELFTIL